VSNKLKITWRILPLFIPLWGPSLKKFRHVKMMFVTHIGKPWIMHALNMFHQMVWILFYNVLDPKHYKLNLIWRHMHKVVNWTLHPSHVPKSFWIRLNLLKSCRNYIAIVPPKVLKFSNNLIVICLGSQSFKRNFTTTTKMSWAPFDI
jgi:hypothetical protein